MNIIQSSFYNICVKMNLFFHQCCGGESSYELLKQEVSAVNLYHGIYMPQA